MKLALKSNNPEYIALLQEFVENIVLEYPDLDLLSMKINLILEEAVSNIVLYGSAQDIEVELTYHEKLVTLKISDDSVAFNPLEKPAADTSKSIEEREIGGLGIFLMKEMTNEMLYDYVDHRNVITMKIQA